MATGAAITAAVTAALAAGTSAYGQHQQSKAARTQRRNQNRALAKERASALEERRTLIDQQRENLSADGSGTRGFSSAGVSANVNKLG